MNQNQIQQILDKSDFSFAQKFLLSQQDIKFTPKHVKLPSFSQYQRFSLHEKQLQLYKEEIDFQNNLKQFLKHKGNKYIKNINLKDENLNLQEQKNYFAVKTGVSHEDKNKILYYHRYYQKQQYYYPEMAENYFTERKRVLSNVQFNKIKPVKLDPSPKIEKPQSKKKIQLIKGKNFIIEEPQYEQIPNDSPQIERLDHNQIINIKSQMTNLKKAQIFRNIQNITKKLQLIIKNRISLDQIIEEKIFSNFPNNNQNLALFLSDARQGNLNSLINMILKNRYIVYDFDFYYQTALFWAVKRNQLEIVNILLHYGSDIDAIDLMGRSPLYLAIKNQNYDMIKLLFYYSACPFKRRNSLSINKVIEQDSKIDSLVKKMRKLFIIFVKHK